MLSLEAAASFQNPALLLPGLLDHPGLFLSQIAKLLLRLLGSLDGFTYPLRPLLDRAGDHREAPLRQHEEDDAEDQRHPHKQSEIRSDE